MTGAQEGSMSFDDPEIYLHMAAGKSETLSYNIIDIVPGEITHDKDSATPDMVELIARATQSMRHK